MTRLKSRIKIEIQSSGVVERRALLVDPSAVYAVFKVALIHPVLEKKNKNKINNEANLRTLHSLAKPWTFIFVPMYLTDLKWNVSPASSSEMPTLNDYDHQTNFHITQRLNAKGSF